MDSQPEFQELVSARQQSWKCTTCIEEWLKLSEEERAGKEARDHIRDADTLVPSWQANMVGPGQLAMACVALPTCLNHIVTKKRSPEEIAQQNGLWAPGQN